MAGKRLTLREISPNDDLTVLLDWRNSKEFQDKLLSFQGDVTMEEFHTELNRAYSHDRHAHFIAWNRRGQPIGTNWIYRYNSKNGTAYTTTFVAPEYRKYAFYGIEMFLLACKYLFEQKGCRKIYSEVHSDNTDSKILFEKLGLPLEACFREHTVLEDGSVADLLVYALYRHQFESSNLAKRIFAVLTKQTNRSDGLCWKSCEQLTDYKRVRFVPLRQENAL